MENSWMIQPIFAVLISFLIATRAYKKKSLDFSGAFSGFLVMATHLAAGLRYGVMLLVFFYSSSALTKYGAEKKQKIDAGYKEGGQRNWHAYFPSLNCCHFRIVIVLVSVLEVMILIT
ncbi:hypothetical protein Ancab_006949 [Ancistrocladus abbreviatus]